MRFKLIFDLKKGDEIFRSNSTCAVLMTAQALSLHRDEQIENRHSKIEN